MKQTINWGVLGDAGIAKKAVIPAIERANNVKILAISSQERVPEQTAKEFAIPKAYSSYEQLLTDPEIDAVYIPLPNALHKKWVVEAALNGKHILCEKPAALTSKEVEEMLSICKQQEVRFMEAFMYQFHPQHKRVKEIIKSGEIGKVKQMNAAFTYILDLTANNIRLNAQLGGGSLYDVGCYCTHAILTILEAEPVSVYCKGKVDEESHVDITVQGTMTFPDQVIATFTSSFEQFPVNQYEVIGTKGRIVVPQAFRPDKQGGAGRLTVTTEHGTREESVVADQYRSQIEYISNAILKGEDLNDNNEHTLKNMRVMDACLRSMSEKKSVQVL
ncbi:Gfo/Idh/MocA family protein [Alkalihalobacterium sp. APHAB7]|uniref:Gfo/Idh/MocA family protein n=1 Tax=Alkalihalobacterium sp. APHAB7 TaxID=3402081 RepID=UPI003AAD9684